MTRRGSFKRQKTDSVSLSDRDIEMLKAVYRYRLLHSGHLLQISGIKHLQSLNLRLRRLYDAKYLDRPKSQRFDWEYGKGKRPMVYGLGNKGGQFIRDNFGWYVPKAGYQTEKNRKLKPVFIQHTLEVADFMIAVETECKNQPNLRFIDLDELLASGGEYVRHRADPVKWPVSLSWKGGFVKLNLVPDGVFGVELLDRPQGKNRAYFFFEADRGTMPLTRKNLVQTSFLRKLLSYRDTWKRGLHQKYFGIKNFRVLTVTTSPERAHNLSAVCKNSFSDMPNGVFLFTDYESVNGVNPFGQIWLNSVAGKVELF